MASNAFGIVTSYGRNIDISEMASYRPVGAFSFLGRYRVIDFAISNLTNSDIERIQVYTGKNPRPILDHLGTGRQYNINSKTGRVQIFFSRDGVANTNYDTDINAYLENKRYLTSQAKSHPYVVITPSYMVFTQDFNELVNTHKESGADITMLYHSVDNAKTDYLDCNYLELNKQKGVNAIKKNNGTAKNRNISMDTYVMASQVFLELIDKAEKISSMYTFADILNDACTQETYDVRGVSHRGYFASITSIKSYYDANLALNNYEAMTALFRQDWPIYTKTNDSCPTQYYEGASVTGSTIANGCYIKGTVDGSILGRGVSIGEGAVVKNSIILADAVIGDGVVVENQVVDKRAKVTVVKELVSPSGTPGYVKRDDNV